MEGAQLCTWKIPSVRNKLRGCIFKWNFWSWTLQLLSLGCQPRVWQRSLSCVNLLNKSKQKIWIRKVGECSSRIYKTLPELPQPEVADSVSEWLLSKLGLNFVQIQHLQEKMPREFCSLRNQQNWFDSSNCRLWMEFKSQAWNDPCGILLSWFCAVSQEMHKMLRDAEIFKYWNF